MKEKSVAQQGFFKEMVNEHSEDECISVRGGQTKYFSLGIQMLQILFSDVDVNKPFRLLVDYSPERPNVIVKTCKPKEDGE